MKDKLGKLLEKLIDNGITIICVSHDLEFVAKYGTMISLLFHSRIIEPLRPKEFFKNNYFYTTQLSKLTRDYNHIISLKDVML
jgi:energy-coupling factor transport system ATP-binding protein